MNSEIIKKFWECIDKARFDALAQIMAEDAVVILPNTRERFLGRNAYIAFNKDYPGRWFAEVEKTVEAGDVIVTAVKIYNEENASLYVTSFFKIKDGKICELTEYWGENGPVPEWRKDKEYSSL